jgi:glycosyltransferase involved in cell wall biosynthesis
VVWRERKSIGVLHVHIVPWISTVGSVLGGLFHLPVVVKESTVTGVATVRGLPFGRLMLKITRARSVFIAMSGAIRRALLAEGISESRIEMIPNGVEAQSRSTVARTPSTCLVVGNLTQGAAKGFDALFRSWVEVLRAVPHAELLVAGTGDPVMFDRFLELQGIARSVKFLGSVSDLQELYRSVAVVALPSRREGMSNALLEAMAAEAPIVATRVSGSEDLIQPGITGVLVEVDDIAGMTSGILGFFNDAGFARRCGERARATVLAQCGMDLVVDRHMALYDRLVRARTQTPTGAGGGRS